MRAERVQRLSGVPERLSQGEIVAAPSVALPRVVHQTWKHAHLRWPVSACAESFKKWNPGWEYRFWTDEECEQLIREELPGFLPVYLGYPTGIFRADIFRVVVLYLRGGVYADLDVECLRPLDDLVEAVEADGSVSRPYHGEWEVLLGRDHPAHERLHFQNRAMWVNAFMVAKLRSRFFRAVLERYAKNLRRAKAFDDVVNQTGPGLFSTVVESCWHGPAGLGIRPLPWRWVHPLPNVYVRFPERRAYRRLIWARTWQDGAQVPMGDDEEGDPSKAGAPFVAHYWWHSYIEGCRVVSMLLQYADSLLLTNGEIAERRLQKWVPQLGEKMDAAGQALAELAEAAGSAARKLEKEGRKPAGAMAACVVVGEPVVGAEEKISFRQLAAEVLAQLSVEVRRVSGKGLASPKAFAIGPGQVAGLLAISTESIDEAAAVRLLEWMSCGATAEGGTRIGNSRSLLLLGAESGVLAGLNWRLSQKGCTLLTESGGWLWQRIEKPAPTIPKVVHFFRTDAAVTDAEAAVSMSTWAIQHGGGNWKFKMWTLPELRAFIAERWPAFLDTFLSYPDDAARFAAGRFLVLKEQGGVAVTAGTICLRMVDELLAETSALVGIERTEERDGKRWQVLGDRVIASEAGHPLWQGIEQDLELRARGEIGAAVGKAFLTRRMQESSSWVAHAQWPKVLPRTAFSPPPLPEKQWPVEVVFQTGGELARWFPQSWGVPVKTLPAKVAEPWMQVFQRVNRAGMRLLRSAATSPVES